MLYSILIKKSKKVLNYKAFARKGCKRCRIDTLELIR